jgi:hypothetical protein
MGRLAEKYMPFQIDTACTIRHRPLMPTPEIFAHQWIPGRGIDPKDAAAARGKRTAEPLVKELKH